MNFRWDCHIALVVVIISFWSCKKEFAKPELDVYGHAGTTIYTEKWVYPANTKESIIYALDILDADGIEVDVQMTKDSVLVLYHDEYLDGNTKFSGCVAQYNFDEIEKTEVYSSQYKLATLEDALLICYARNKKLFIDAKPYNYCVSGDVNLATFNRALNNLLVDYTSVFKSTITFNTQNKLLLENITDTLIQKSFETENIDLAKALITDGVATEICLNYKYITASFAKELNELTIAFSIFGVKTEKDIQAALGLQPKKIISDNIAYTKKNSY